jgi:hypothetical protein
MLFVVKATCVKVVCTFNVPTLKVQTTLTRAFPSKSEYNHIILQVNLHAFHV